MAIRGVRGATTVERDSAEGILEPTRELMIAVRKANPTLEPDDIASTFFTMNAVHYVPPPTARRVKMGWYGPVFWELN
jgi:chorismate mutase